METPHDIDLLLSSILESSKSNKPQIGHAGGERLSADDRAFLDRMIQAINDGSKAVFMVVNPDNSLDYLIANESRVGAIAMLARMIQRTARHIEEEGEA